MVKKKIKNIQYRGYLLVPFSESYNGKKIKYLWPNLKSPKKSAETISFFSSTGDGRKKKGRGEEEEGKRGDRNLGFFVSDRFRSSM